MTEPYDDGSRVEAVAAVTHHRHHPADPNAGVVRGRLGPHAALAGLLAAAVTVVAVVLYALAIGGGH